VSSLLTNPYTLVDGKENINGNVKKPSAGEIRQVFSRQNTSAPPSGDFSFTLYRFRAVRVKDK
jgi:hypothetical protein